jgi:conjugal transfer/entry exclusion protein
MKKQKSFDDLVFSLFKRARVVVMLVSLGKAELELKKIKNVKERKKIQFKIDKIKEVLEKNYERFYSME